MKMFRVCGGSSRRFDKNSSGTISASRRADGNDVAGRRHAVHEDLDAAGHIVSACGLGGVDPVAGCASPPWDVIFGAESTRTYKPQPATYVVAHT